MQECKNIQILIPEGYFEGDCYTCFYAKYKSVRSDRSLFCNKCEDYVFPEDNLRCSFYCWKVTEWIKIGLFMYFAVASIVVIIEWFFLK